MSIDTISQQENKIEYFNVPLARLLVFSILSFGLYDIYWVYKNWECIKNHEKININSMLRAFFAPLFIYSFFKRVNFAIRSAEYRPSIGPKLLTLIYFLTILISIFVDNIFNIVSPSFTILPLLYLQKQINHLYGSQDKNPQYQPNTRLPLFFVVLGTLIWVILILGNLFL